MQWSLLALTGALAILVGVLLLRSPAARPGVAARASAREAFQTAARAKAPDGDRLAHVPLPGDRSPLAPHLARAVDVGAPAASTAGGEDVPFSNDEVREVLRRVVARINGVNKGLDLALVSFDNVRKTVDAYKTLRYEADAQVHSVAQMYSSRFTATVDITSSNAMYIRGLSVHSAAKDTSGVAAGTAALAAHERYAPFEPAVAW